MKIWLLTVALGFPSERSGLPFVTEQKCKQAAAEAAFIVPGVRYYCNQVQRTDEHNLFFIELAQSKERLRRARAARRQERVMKALYNIE